MKAKIVFTTLTLLLSFYNLLSQDTFGDNFGAVSYANNDGTNPFLGNWVETGETTSPSAGVIRVDSDQLRFRNMDAKYITRDLDLSSYASAGVTLTLDYNTTNGNEGINVQLYNGTAYVTVANLTGTGSITYELAAAEMTANSSIRFISSTGGWSANETIFIDNLLFTAAAPNDPPVVLGAGDQVYCPGASIPIANSITITDPDDVGTSAMYIQISGGYVNGEDLLTLTGSHPSLTTSWDTVQGELTLLGPATYAEYEAAVLATEFSSSSPNPSGTREFSITVGEANFLPSTGHYYEFVTDPGISWTDAEIAASNRNYFGLQGYLVTLTSQEESDFSGSQAQGVGWIGANDDNVEGEWRWVFWAGGVGGTELTFAFWNANEPNDYPDGPTNPGDENFAHITDPSVTANPGSWNDLPNGGGGGAYSAQGYVVEYGGTAGDPVLNITATTVINISNCRIMTNRRITYRVNRD